MRETSPGRQHRRQSRCWSGLLWSGLALSLACDPAPERGTGTLRVLVLDEPVSPSPVVSAQVALQGLAVAAFTDAAGYAVLPGLPAGAYLVAAGMVGYCSAKAPATVAANTITDLTVTLCPAPGEGAGGGGDQVSVTASGVQLGWLMFDAAVSGGACLHDIQVPGVAKYLLGVNALPSGSTDGGGVVCPTSVTLFTPSHGLLFTDDPAALPWTGGTDDVVLSPPPLLNVPLSIWVAPGVGSAALRQDILDLHLKLARAIFSAAGAGFALTADEVAGGDPVVTEIPASAPGATLFAAGSAGCGEATQIMAHPAIYHADKLNIYYVGSITGRGAASAGYYCFLEGARPILFVRATPNLPHTLAHEIGHALGLLEPNWGHTHDFLAGFLAQPDGAPRNFMAYGAAGDAARPIYATQGQVFRMNFSPLSWVNLPGSGGLSLRQRAGAILATVPCPCAAAERADDCPLLSQTTLPPDHLTSGPAWELACAVAPAVETITLCTGEARAVRASFATTLDGTALPARSPDIIWITDNPIVAVLDPDAAFSGVDGSGAGWAEQQVIGGAAGSATVTLFAGGPSASGRYSLVVQNCP